MKPSELGRELKAGEFTFPGCYPKFFITNDGAALCFQCVKKEGKRITEAMRNPHDHSGWKVEAVEVNWEEPDLICAHCNERIPSAYAEDEVS